MEELFETGQQIDLLNDEEKDQRKKEEDISINDNDNQEEIKDDKQDAVSGNSGIIKEKLKKWLPFVLEITVIIGVLVMGVITYKSFNVNSDNDPSDNIKEKVGEEISSNIVPMARADDIPQEEKDELIEVYNGMQEDNPDFAGYISIPGSTISYPVMYTPNDPEKYLHLDYYEAEADGGVPFIDARCSIDPDSDNVIIYGHNMKDGSMFTPLISYQDKSYFEEHPVIRFDTKDEIREYEIMSVFYDRVYYDDEDVFKFYNFIDAKNEAEFNETIGQYLKKSIYDTGVDAEYGDKLVTLVTCAYHTDNGRFVVVAKRNP